MIEKDRMEMDLKRAQLKVAIRKGMTSGSLKLETGENFDTYLSQLTDVEKSQLLGGEHGIEKKDEIFKKMKRKKVAWAFAKTTLSAATLGFGFQEARAFLDYSTDGVIEGALKSLRDHASGGETKEFLNNHMGPLQKNGTALEYLRRWWFGEHAMLPSGTMHEETFGKIHFNLPEGASMIENPDHTIDLLRNGEVIVKHLNFDDHGNLSAESQEAFKKIGIFSNLTTMGGKTTEEINEYLYNCKKVSGSIAGSDFHDDRLHAKETGPCRGCRRQGRTGSGHGLFRQERTVYGI